MRIDFNPRSPSRERRADGTSTLSDTYISIHALQAESDDKDGYVLSFLLTISIHALQAESDFNVSALALFFPRFQSTLSKQRATSVDPFEWSLRI